MQTAHNIINLAEIKANLKKKSVCFILKTMLYWTLQEMLKKDVSFYNEDHRI